MLVRRLAALSLIIAACTPMATDFTSLNAGPIEAPRSITPPAPPAATALPKLTPCPGGWMQHEDTCEPWPSGPATPCGPDEARFPGTAACTRIGTACTADDWATDLPAGALFVKPGTSPGGNGTRTSPFSTIDLALQAATNGSIVALSKGTHPAPFSVPAGITLWGACVAQTTVAGSTAPALSGAGPGATVKNLRVTGGRGGLVASGAGAELAVTDVLVDSAVGIGWAALSGGISRGTRVVIKDTRLSPTNTLGNGVTAIGGGQLLAAQQVVISGSRGYGLFVDGANSRAELSDVAITDTTADPAGQASGVSVGHGGAVQLHSAIIERNVGRGLEVTPGSTLELTDAVIRDTLPVAASTSRLGAGLISTGTVNATRLWCSGNTAYGIASYAGTVTLTDSVIDGTKNSTVIQGGIGLGAVLGSVTATRVAVRRSATVGVESNGAGSTLNATDLTITGTLAPAGGFGWGLATTSGGHATVSRATIEETAGMGIELGHDNASLIASDVTIRRTRPTPVGGEIAGGEGIVVSQGSTAQLDRVALEDNTSAGLMVAVSTVTVHDLAIRDTNLPTESRRLGAGVLVMEGGQLLGERVAVERSHLEGLFSDGAGSRIALTDVAVRVVDDAPCTGPNCSGVRPVGALAVHGGAVDLDRFLLAHCDGFGAVVYGGQLDLENGDVWGNDIGVNLIDMGYDVNRVNRDVRYLFNTQKLAAEVIPLPSLPSER